MMDVSTEQFEKMLIDFRNLVKRAERDRILAIIDKWGWIEFIDHEFSVIKSIAKLKASITEGQV